jgi:hypothetical protein
MEFDFGPGLSFHGPIINTTLTITEEHREALNRAGLPVPAPVICRFLIDTGADVMRCKASVRARRWFEANQCERSSPWRGN